MSAGVQPQGPALAFDVADDELGRLDRVRLHRKLGAEMGLKAVE